MTERSTPVRAYPGVGVARAKALEKLGLATAGDLLGYYPRDYEDRTKQYGINDAPPDTPVCIPAVVAEVPRFSRIRKGLELVKTRVVDGSASMQVTFFNQSYLQEVLHPGEEYVFYGKVEGEGTRRQMTNPVFEPVGKARFTGRIMPIYPLTAGISNHLLAGLVRWAVEECGHLVQENLPPDIIARHALAGAECSCRAIHFPESWEALDLARRRLIFEELFTLSAGLALLRERRGQGVGLTLQSADLTTFYKGLPFTLTTAQRRTVDEAAADLTSGRPMNRLVQGDVGSGKTVVAAACAYLAHRSGYQTAMMAPTEILAEQHRRSLTALLAHTGMAVGLLTGSMRAAEKRKVCEALGDGTLHFVVGTHALLSEGVAFQNLGLVVTDEQHRFGVNQRSALAAKGERPHALVMSATPIPRTLALLIYGDLDVSVIDELPPGRKPIGTVLVGESKRERMHGFVRAQVGEGRQVYIVCPAIEDHAGIEGGPDLKAVKQYAETLQTKVFPDLRVAFLHGKLKPKEKDAVMAAFAGGELDVLVSTTVIEVGVDVPNASLMIIENAERYGLSQLHQLRGRVGRGEHPSWCVLVSGSRNPDTRARLKVLVDTSDGFKIAEEDLKLRGPGDFFGARQHGLPVLRVADLNTDTRVLKEAQDAAKDLLTHDPELADPLHAPLLERVKRLFEGNPDMFN